ncbi:hypothetical protein I4F81_003345 [Pyropia yezoensis]|uniref:Uncharacterized protein n=1 Tax=Pyropia yezoensis TaxID=2788 RepID=A0ACC3BTC1_PYRYE|nr:hypothetical protein I4F81_003345 [Neopyropia yezoensis]
MAVGRKLREEFLVPWGVITSLDTPTRAALYTRLLGDDDGGASAAGVSPPASRWARRAFFLHAQHGLGNRLRALSAAGAYAVASGRVLVVVWEADAHVGARLEALLDTAAAPFVVTETWAPRYPFFNASAYDAAWRTIDAYSYMPADAAVGGVKQARIVDAPGQHIYLKSAYTLETSAPLHSADRETAYLRSLTPAAAVLAHTARCAARGVADRVGVHIRCLSVAAEGLPIDADREYTAAGVAATDAHRASSAAAAFVAEARRLRAADPTTQFFVAADDPAAAATFRAALGGDDDDGNGDGDAASGVVDGLWGDPPGGDAAAAPGTDRGEAAMVRAAADLYCLSATRSLLGSEWSAFTKTAVRLGGLPVRYAGADFGGVAAPAGAPPTGGVEGGGGGGAPPSTPPPSLPPATTPAAAAPAGGGGGGQQRPREGGGRGWRSPTGPPRYPPTLRRPPRRPPPRAANRRTEATADAAAAGGRRTANARRSHSKAKTKNWEAPAAPPCPPPPPPQPPPPPPPGGRPPPPPPPPPCPDRIRHCTESALASAGWRPLF